MKLSALYLLFPIMTAAANYSAERITSHDIEVVRLADAARETVVSIAPSLGNKAFEMKVKGKNVLYFPFDDISGLKATPTMCAVPFLWPWANRIDGDAYWVNGRKYLLNPDLANFRYDANHKPIHGLIVYSSDWQVVRVEADAHAAWVTSRFDFAKYPELMAQFPFAHTVEMTYRLQNGVLEVRTAVHNQSAEPIPIAMGFHPYFQLHDAPRDQWKVHLAAREEYLLSNVLIPTGEKKPVAVSDPQPLAGTQLDNVFGSLIRGEDGKAHFWVQGKQEKLEVIYGPKFTVAVAYAPPGKEFVCFEPMAAPTNAFNLAHAGLYKELQSVAPGKDWQESFWISPSGF
jgi:aldose 1-epimerase